MLSALMQQRSSTYQFSGPTFSPTLRSDLVERVLPMMHGADERHRVPSSYWKVIATEDGRMAAFIMDTAAPASFNHYAARANLDDVELRARQILFPRLATRNIRDLSRDLGCTSP